MRCPRLGCNGCLCWNYEEWYCANCGWRHIEPDPPELDMDEARWQSVLCSQCHMVPAVANKELCPGCLQAQHQRCGRAQARKETR
jgi:hypothetical protein